jgi:hypothetical protein
LDGLGSMSYGVGSRSFKTLPIISTDYAGRLWRKARHLFTVVHKIAPLPLVLLRSPKYTFRWRVLPRCLISRVDVVVEVLKFYPLGFTRLSSSSAAFFSGVGVFFRPEGLLRRGALEVTRERGTGWSCK